MPGRFRGEQDQVRGAGSVHRFGWDYPMEITISPHFTVDDRETQSRTNQAAILTGARGENAKRVLLHFSHSRATAPPGTTPDRHQEVGIGIPRGFGLAAEDAAQEIFQDLKSVAAGIRIIHSLALLPHLTIRQTANPRNPAG